MKKAFAAISIFFAIHAFASQQDFKTIKSPYTRDVQDMVSDGLMYANDGGRDPVESIDCANVPDNQASRCTVFSTQRVLVMDCTLENCRVVSNVLRGEK